MQGMAHHTQIDTAKKLRPHPEFAARLRSLRKSRSLSQMDLALELGGGQDTILRWEKGRQCPGDEMLYRLLQFFGQEQGALLLADEDGEAYP